MIQMEQLLGLPDWVIIFILALVFSFVMALITRKTGVKQKTDAIQKTIKEHQAEMSKAVKDNDTRKIEELRKKEPEVMKLMNDMMILPFKNMIFSIPLFLGFVFIAQTLFPSFLQQLPIALHLNGEELMRFPPDILKTSTYGPRGFFIISSIVTGMAIEAIWSRIAKKP